jgi:hypothetical protein
VGGTEKTTNIARPWRQRPKKSQWEFEPNKPLCGIRLKWHQMLRLMVAYLWKHDFHEVGGKRVI